MPDGFRVAPAARSDVPAILELIRELAELERLADEVVATEQDLERTLFGDRPSAEVLMARVDSDVAGFALFFHNYSTFLGRPGLYLEDLYVRPAFRGRGYGRSLLAHLARIALDRECGRMEWWVLDWNKPAIRFYERLGAEAMDDWTVYRLTGPSLSELAEDAQP